MIGVRTFFEAAEFPFLEAVRADLPALQAEARRLVASYDSLAGTYPSIFNVDGLLSQGSRARFLLCMAGLKLRVNQARCPAAAAALAAVPGLVSGGFYLLGPGSVIKPHTGAKVQFLRVHLGLVVPDGCALKVGEETRAWQEGEFLVFDDSHLHEAWNHSQQTRCVLHLDFFPNLEPDAQAALIGRLQEQIVKGAPAYHAPLLAAGVEAEAPLIAHMRSALASVRAGHPDLVERQLRQLDELVAAHGLFLGY